MGSSADRRILISIIIMIVIVVVYIIIIEVATVPTFVDCGMRFKEGFSVECIPFILGGKPEMAR